MRTARIITLAMLAAFTAGPAFAQAAAPSAPPSPVRKLSPEDQADSDGLRALAKATPALPMERVELKVTAPFKLSPVSAMTQDKAGNIYVFHRPTDTTTDNIVVLDHTGKYLRSWGKGAATCATNGQAGCVMPHGIKVDPDGNVWTIDAHTSLITKYTNEGKQLLQINVGEIPNPERPFCSTTDVAFLKNGHVLISDGYCNARFIEYDAAGKKLHQWGEKGKGPGQFNLVHDVSVSADNSTIFVADRENGRVQWFDMNGKYLGEKHFGGQLFSAQVGPDGMVYVGTHAKGVGYEQDSHIFKFDPKTGKVIGKIDAFAHQMNVGADGTVLPGPVTVLTDNGNSLLIFRAKKG